MVNILHTHILADIQIETILPTFTFFVNQWIHTDRNLLPQKQVSICMSKTINQLIQRRKQRVVNQGGMILCLIVLWKLLGF